MDVKNENLLQRENPQESDENTENRQHCETKNISEAGYKASLNQRESQDLIHPVKIEERSAETFYSGMEKPVGVMAAIPKSNRIFLVLSWISAAFTACVSPYFAVPGILLGAFANRAAPGSGNAAIITNVVLAVINLVFGLFLMFSLRRTFG